MRIPSTFTALSSDRLFRIKNSRGEQIALCVMVMGLQGSLHLAIMSYNILPLFIVATLYLLNAGAKGQCIDGKVSLVGGSGPHEGRVEVCSNGVWGTVCDDDWNDYDAVVVCKQLGYDTKGAKALSNAYFGAGAGSILMDDVACSGTETQLTSCSHISQNNCGHREDASVQCSPSYQKRSSSLRAGVCMQRESTIRYRTTMIRVSYITRYRSWLFRYSKVAYRYQRQRVSFTDMVTVYYCCPGYRGDGVTCTPICNNPQCVHGRCTRPNYCTCYRGWTGSACNIERCTGNNEGKLRLAGGTSLSGRLELCGNGRWGTICDDSWDNNDASVACHQLGLSRRNAVGGTATSPGTGPILMDNVHCVGTETKLSDCSHSSVHNCDHSEDASVTCVTRRCEDNEVQLRGSGSTTGSIRKGRVEVCKEESWGTVCDHGWTTSDARVVCAQLGFLRSGASSYSDALFGQGRGPILLNNVACTGTESRLIDCSADPIGVTGSCTHADDAGVSCRISMCTTGDLSLVGGLSDNEGRLELCYNNRWGTICDDLWAQASTNVACRQLGITDSAHVMHLTNNIFGTASSTVPILLDDVRCRGTETSLLRCRRRSVGTHNCQHSDDISLRCGVCREGDVRLVDGESDNEGRVEVCLSGRWGTVCDDGWSQTNTHVVCNQLGYDTTGATSLAGAHFTTTYSIPIVMDEVSCSGTETKLSQCTYRNIASLTHCSHSEDTRIRCPLSPPGRIPDISVTPRHSSMNIGWSPPPPLTHSAPITQYIITCSAYDLPSISERTTGTSIVLTGLRPETWYHCCVAADSLSGSGERYCRRTPTSQEPRSIPPRNLAGVVTSPYSITLSWLPPRAPRGEITAYHVNLTEKQTYKEIQKKTTATSQGIQVTGLHPFYNYSIQVMAFTDREGEPEIIENMRTFSDVPSAPPRAAEARDITTTSFSVLWQPPPPEHRNGVITHYRLRVENVCTRSTTYTTIQPSDVPYTVEHLTPYTTYNCSVRAATVNGTGNSTDETSITTLEDVPSGPPLYPGHIVLDHRSINVTWNPPGCQYENGRIRSYNLELNDTVGTRIVTGTSHIVNNLRPCSVYAFRVAAFTVGLGPYSEWKLVTMPEPPDGTCEILIMGTALNSTSIRLEWWFGHRVTYRVQCTETNIGRELSPNVTNNTSIIIGGLHPYTNYSCNVSATAIDVTYSSYLVNVTTHPDVPSAAPGELTAQYIGSRNVTLTWNKLAGKDARGEIRYYIIHVVPTQSTPWLRPNEQIVPFPDLSYTVLHLHPHSNYNISVAAFTIGAGPNSGYISIQTEPEPPLGSPLGLFADPLSPTSLFVSWQPPSPQSQNGDIQSYIIRLEETGTREVTLTTTTDLEITIESLRPFHEYSVSVAATTVADGPYSSEVVVTMPESCPSEPNVTVVDISSNFIELRIIPPVDRNGIITSYIIKYNHSRGSNGSLEREPTAYYVLSVVPYTTYELSVAANNSACQGNFSDPAVMVQTLEDDPCCPPASVWLENITSTSLELRWDPLSLHDANGWIRSYTIRCTELETERKFEERSTKTETNITLRELHPFYTYNCSVAAVTVGRGPFSDPVVNRTLEDAPSHHPYDLVANESTPTSLTLTWTEPDPSKWNGVLRYYVVHVIEPHLLYNVSYPSTSLRVTGLRPYTTYEIQVAAVTIAAGPYYTTELQTEEDIPTAPPENFSAKPVSPTELLMTWRPPPKCKQNGRIRYYAISVNETDTEEESEYDTSDNTVHWTVTALHPYYTYHVQVAAVTVGLGPFTEPVPVQMPEASPSESPTSLIVADMGPSYASLQWTPPPESSHNGIIRHYLINLIVEGNSSEPTRNLTSTSSRPSITIGYLQSATSYTCSVAAVTVGPGPLSNSIQFTTEPHVPGSVRSLVADALSSRSMSISWQPPGDGEGAAGQITDYVVNVTLLAASEEDIYSTTTQSESVVVGSLHPDYLYQCSVVPRTSAGPGPSTHTLLRLPQDVPTSSPQSVNAFASDPTTLHLYWSPPPLDHQNGYIIQYGINITDIGQGLTYQYNTSGSDTSLVINDLHPYYTYQYMVTAFTVVGNGPYSQAEIRQMPSAAPSSAPLNLSLHEIGSSYALLRWVPPSEPDRNGVIEYYQVYLNSSQGPSIIYNSAGPQTHILLNSLYPNTQYVCSVAAVTVSPGPPSTAVLFTTNISVQGTVESLTAIPLSPRSANISWQTPRNGAVFLDFLVTITPLYRHSQPRYNTTSSTSVVISELKPGAFYLCMVGARSQAGLQQSVSTILMELPPDVPDGFPRNVHAVPLDSRTLHLVWSPPPEEERNGEIVRYGVNLTEVETGRVTQHLTSDSVTSITIHLLHPYYHYHYAVTAFTSAGNGPYSLTFMKRMPQDAPDGPPLNVTVANVSPRVVVLHWVPPPSNSHNGDITGYVIKTFDAEQQTQVKDTETDNVTSHTLSGLKTAHSYELSVAARTVVGWGPFSKTSFIFTINDVPSAPVGVSVQRISATQIGVSWPPLSQERAKLPIRYYTVKYYALENHVRLRRDESNALLVNTQTNLTLNDLDPGFTYSVAVSATSSSGTGQYSEEINVGFSENSFFQLFLYGAIDCQEWVFHHIDAKLKSLRDSLSLTLEETCQCQFTTRYLLFNKPNCLSAHPDWLILWGRIIGTNHTSSVDIRNHLQRWSNAESKTVVEGVHLTTLKFCTVYLVEGQPPFCEAPTLPPVDHIIERTSDNGPSSVVVYSIVGVVALMFVIILAVLTCFGTVSCYKKKKVKDRQSRFHATHPLEAVGGTTYNRNGDDDYASVYYTTADSIYETVLDDGPLGVTLPAPPAPPPLPLFGSHAHVPTNNPPAAEDHSENSASSSEEDEYSGTQSSTSEGLIVCPIHPQSLDNGTDAISPVTVGEMESVCLDATEQQPNTFTDSAMEDATGTGSGMENTSLYLQQPANPPATDAGAASPYQRLTNGSLSNPNTYQSLLKETRDAVQESEQCPSPGTSSDHNQQESGPPTKTGYKLLGVRDKENDYQLPLPQQQPVEDGCTTQS